MRLGLKLKKIPECQQCVHEKHVEFHNIKHIIPISEFLVELDIRLKTEYNQECQNVCCV